MAKKLTPRQVVKELNDIVETFSGKTIAGWVQEAWERSKQTTIGQAAAGVERVAMAVDPYTILGLPNSASLEEVEARYRRLAKLFHPDVGGNEAAMKLVNNAYQQVIKGKKNHAKREAG